MRRMLYLSYWIFMQANMATATASEWVPARQTLNAIYCVPPTLHSPPCPLLQPPLCRPEHEYFAQNAVCYITHIIIGKSRQRILSPRTHTHAHIWRAGSLGNANDPTHFGPTPTHPAGTYVAVAAPAAGAEAEVRTRSRTWASCTPPSPPLLPPSSLASYASAVLHYPLPRQPLVSRHAVASRGSCRCGWVTATATATLQHF